MDESIYDIFSEFSSFFVTMIRGFRQLLFLEDSSYYMTFIFITVPILFAALEAIFDFIIPTFTDLRPMGIRRFFIPKAEALKCPEMKAYKPIRAEGFSPVRFNGFNILKYRKHRSEKFNTTFTPAEEKHYQFLYQQKYNTTASPLELRRFVYSEVKRYGYVPSYTVFNYKGMKSSVIGAVGLGIKGYKFYTLHKKDKNDPDNYLDVDLTESLENRGDNLMPDAKRSYHSGSTEDTFDE